MTKATRYPPELRERAMRLVREHREEHASKWAAIESLAKKLGMTPETLRKWLRRDAVDHGQRPGVTSSERERIRDLERENRELRRANEILKAAAVFFAREFDPRLPKPRGSSPSTRRGGVRADLPGVAGRPEQLLRRDRPAGLCTPTARRVAAGCHPARLGRAAPDVRRRQGLGTAQA